ncbi:hypothetical protein PsorP6_002120 [Peronosclerospora sorghi]|uniref:Uncharacterized protein n=1 Tax=Peronosclerospora sorghi TaxID=230839 RepID=A0ACC0WTB5_9STRA|nr:hypothetical protein PsorP6_002120 [Peronosclerospora sorghi]
MRIRYDFIDFDDTSKAVESRHETLLGDKAKVFTFVNPRREEFELAGFKKVLGIENDAFSKTSTFFDDYSWRSTHCFKCNRNIGWVFYHAEIQKCVITQYAKSITTKKAKKELLASTTRKQKNAEIVKKVLEGQCIFTLAGWWTYEICYAQEVRQFHQEPDGSRPSDWSMGVYVSTSQKSDAVFTDSDVVQYFDGGQICDENGESRSTKVIYTCCKSRPKEVMVEKVDEPVLCTYVIRVCVPSLCDAAQETKENSYVENEQVVESCKAKFEADHPDAKLASFTALDWSSVISEDSSELDWARRMQFAN